MEPASREATVEETGRSGAHLTAVPRNHFHPAAASGYLGNWKKDTEMAVSSLTQPERASLYLSTSNCSTKFTPRTLAVKGLEDEGVSFPTSSNINESRIEGKPSAVSTAHNLGELLNSDRTALTKEHVLVCSSCRNKIPQTAWLKKQIFSLFWRLRSSRSNSFGVEFLTKALHLAWRQLLLTMSSCYSQCSQRDREREGERKRK